MTGAEVLQRLAFGSPGPVRLAGPFSLFQSAAGSDAGHLVVAAQGPGFRGVKRELLPSVRCSGKIGSVTRFFRWNGSYLGFSSGEYLFDPNGSYIGWMEGDGSVWRSDGSYAGEVVDEDHVLKRSIMVPPVPRVPRVPPVPPVPLVPPVPRVPRVPRVGWDEAF